MSAKITNEQINAAFDIARRVYLDELKASVGANQLSREHGININCAIALIRDYRHLRKGECYRRTLSTPAADVFLNRIFEEDGADALASAIAAVWVQTCPELKKFAVVAISAARCRSASSKTISGDFPPSSIVTSLSVEPPADAITFFPVDTPPVKEIFSIPGCSAKAGNINRR